MQNYAYSPRRATHDEHRPLSDLFKAIAMGSSTTQTPMQFAQNDLNERTQSSKIVPLRNYGFLFVVFTIVLGFSQIPLEFIFLKLTFFPKGFSLSNFWESTLLDFTLCCIACIWFGTVLFVNLFEVFVSEHAQVNKNGKTYKKIESKMD